MASSGSDVWAERAAAAVNDLVVAREGVERLKSILLQLGDHRAPWAEQVADGVLNRLSNAMAALDGAAAGGQSPAARSGGARPQPSASSSGNTRKRSFSRRSQHAYEQRITATLDDGYIWRKYGQKEILKSPNPRSYFRCTHKSDQGCPAKRHVQRCDADPSKHVVTYFGEHTCRDPSKIVQLAIHDAAGAASDGGASNLISFAPTCRTNAGSTGGAPSQMVAMDGSATQLATSWCASDDVFSSSAGSFMQVDELGAVVSSAVVMSRTAAGSAPAIGGGLGDMIPVPCSGGAGAGSLPSSPNSLGFEVGDDDFFRLELDP